MGKRLRQIQQEWVLLAYWPLTLIILGLMVLLAIVTH